MSGKSLPDGVAVGKLISSLVGKPVSHKPAPAMKKLPPGGAVGVFVNEARQPVALVIADLAVAAASGAALAMIPAGAAQDAVKAGALPANMADNFREVINVMSTLLTGHAGKGVRLTDFDVGKLPEPAGALFAAPAGRLDLELEVQGYGKGALSVLTV